MFSVFIPLFVVMNSLPVLPLVMTHTSGLETEQREPLVRRSLLTGGLLASGMILGGPLLLSYLGITLLDLQVGGGVILLVFAIHDLLFSVVTRKRRALAERFAVVPLGVPILMGPATLTTVLVLSDAHGKIPVLAALAGNLVINWILVANAQRLAKGAGLVATQAAGKVYALLLTAIAVAMIRKGVFGMIETHIT